MHKQVPFGARMGGADCEFDGSRPRGTEQYPRTHALWSSLDAGYGVVRFLW